MTTKKHQIKSQWYYWFWGAATVSVLAGQIYVGTGYRQMSVSVNNLTKVFVHILRSNR